MTWGLLFLIPREEKPNLALLQCKGMQSYLIMQILTWYVQKLYMCVCVIKLGLEVMVEPSGLLISLDKVSVLPKQAACI